jgi:hypothetical protein
VHDPSRRTAASPQQQVGAVLLHDTQVIALRQRATVALGGLADRAGHTAGRLVTALDLAGHTCWVPADAVWSDAAGGRRPEHPRPIGMATAPTLAAATVKGLSDRLGWEAVLEFERGGDLPGAGAELPPVPNAIVLDGRLGHDIPTVVVLATDTVRWGAGSTWDRALRRALYGTDAETDPAGELIELGDLLLGADLAAVTVDLGTPVLRSAGIARCSVQLVAGNASVRSWDAR